MTRFLYGSVKLLAVASVFGLAACGGGDHGGGATPVPTPGQTLGSFDPTSPPAAQTLDVVLATGTGVWEIPLDGTVRLDLGGSAGPVIASALRYDANRDEMWIMVGSEWYRLPGFSTGDSQSSGCPGSSSVLCVEYLGIAKGDYSETAWFGTSDPSPLTDNYVHFGLDTAAADMPLSGSASYSGESEYAAQVNGSFDSFVSGTPTINVDFSTGAVVFADSATDIAVGLRQLTVNGAATISGNSYSGSVTGTYDPNITVAGDQLVFGSGTMSGTFYGPAASAALLSETAGVISAADTDATNADLGGDGSGTSSTGAVIGGYWTKQDSSTP